MYSLYSNKELLAQGIKLFKLALEFGLPPLIKGIALNNLACS